MQNQKCARQRMIGMKRIMVCAKPDILLYDDFKNKWEEKYVINIVARCSATIDTIQDIHNYLYDQYYLLYQSNINRCIMRHPCVTLESKHVMDSVREALYDTILMVDNYMYCQLVLLALNSDDLRTWTITRARLSSHVNKEVQVSYDNNNGFIFADCMYVILPESYVVGVVQNCAV